MRWTHSLAGAGPVAGLLMTLSPRSAAAAQQPTPRPVHRHCCRYPPTDTAKVVDELAADRFEELDQQLRVLQRKL